MDSFSFVLADASLFGRDDVATVKLSAPLEATATATATIVDDVVRVSTAHDSADMGQPLVNRLFFRSALGILWCG